MSNLLDYHDHMVEILLDQYCPVKFWTVSFLMDGMSPAELRNLVDCRGQIDIHGLDTLRPNLILLCWVWATEWMDQRNAFQMGSKNRHFLPEMKPIPVKPIWSIL